MSAQQATQPAVWLAVPDWSSYQVAPASGRVRSIDHAVVDQLGRVRQIRGRELVVTAGRVNLSHGPSKRTMRVTQIAEAAVAAAEGEA